MGAENDGERDPGRGDRDAVGIAAPTPEERVAEPPSLRLQPAECSSDLCLGLSADAAASSLAHPAAGVEHQGGRDQCQQSRWRGGAGGGGYRRQPDSRDRRGAACGGAAQTPSLLAARETRMEHRHKLAGASDTSPGTCYAVRRSSAADAKAAPSKGDTTVERQLGRGRPLPSWHFGQAARETPEAWLRPAAHHRLLGQTRPGSRNYRPLCDAAHSDQSSRLPRSAMLYDRVGRACR